MRRAFASVTAATLIATSAAGFAAPIAAAPTGSYTLDPSHTTVMFSLSHMGYSHYFGRFNNTAGTLDFNSALPEKSKLNVTIDTKSIDVNHTMLEEDLRSPKWLDAAQYPTITFTSTAVQKLSETKGKLTGNLTLHGITKPVMLDVTFNNAGVNPISRADMLGFSATGSFNRSEFGVSEGIPLVGDTLAITIETEFQRKP